MYRVKTLLRAGFTCAKCGTLREDVDLYPVAASQASLFAEPTPTTVRVYCRLCAAQERLPWPSRYP